MWETHRGGWDGAVTTEQLRTAIIDVECIQTEVGDGKRGCLAAARRPGDDDHPRTIHALSSSFECRVRLREHIRWQLGRDDVSGGIDDPEVFESRASGREPCVSDCF